MRVALDAMGGDQGPAPVVAGALQAIHADRKLRVILVGDQAQLEPLVAAQAPGEERLEVFHASQVVTMEDAPAMALRRKPDSSVLRAWQLLAERKAEAVVSAGNTGAVVAAGLRLNRFLKGVQRPGIGVSMPTQKGPCLLLDAGANVSPRPSHLYQYGVMGLVYARHMFQCDQPTIGLINIGSEEGKGSDLSKETLDLFKNSPLAGNFVGNIEGRDIHRGKVDVVVCDGFTGNVILKTCEGLFAFLMKEMAREVIGPLQAERPVAEAGMQRLIAKFDYSSFGGAPLLGIDGICIKCHGSSGETAIKNALLEAARQNAVQLNQLIIDQLEEPGPLAPAGG
jgi:glycerol-3-phosphate acyltransferase PlsX